MNAIGASTLIVLMGIVLFSPRRWALVGMMAGILYLTHGQVHNLFGFNLFGIRFLELAGFARILLRKEFLFHKFNGIDRTILFLYAYTTLVTLIRSDTGQAYIIGIMVDALLSYFIFRSLIINADDLKWFLGVFVILLFPYVVLVSVEMRTHNNPFALIGGLSFVERAGRLRCMGSFRHPSLLGTLGAAFIPLYIALIFTKNMRIFAFFAIGLCFAIVYLANSGGPLSATAIGLVGWLFWIVRAEMFLVRRLLACLIIILGLIMKAPIWYLPVRLSSLSGGDGWHRSYLMDVAFRDIGRWGLAGMNADNTKDWFPYQLVATGSADVTNQYLAFGLSGGLFAIAIFFFLLNSAFQAIGQAMIAVRSAAGDIPTETEYLLWGLGCALLVHISTWLGITYNFDQTYQIWFMQLAAISSISQYFSQEGIEANLKPSTKNDLKSIKYSIYKANRNTAEL